MRNVLVTGGAGFIGSNFVHFLLRETEDIRVVTLDSLTYAGSLANLRDLPSPERHILVEGDIGDPQVVNAILRDHDIDTVVHFAAETHVDRSISGAGPFIDTNVRGTFILLEGIKQAWTGNQGSLPRRRRFLHVSTDEVFGSLTPEEPAFSEHTRYQPNSPYAASKAASDHLVRAYGHTYNLPVIITNCSNNYGPRQFPEKLVPLMLLNAVEGKALPIYGDGQQIRDWLFVEDHCRALLAVLQQGQVGDTYNIGGGNQPTNLELVRLLCQILDELRPDSPHCPHESLISHVADRPGHDRRYAMDDSKIRQDLNWRPQEDLESGLRKTVGWYLEHPEWVDAVRKQPSYQQWLSENYVRRGETQ